MTQITYDVLLDETNEFIEELKVTTLCASKAPDAPKISKEKALTEAPHIAFTAVYRFSDRNEVAKFQVPAGAAKALR
jgi:hypothetical protein